MPKLQVSVSAPRGKITLSSLSSCNEVFLLCGEAGKSSPGSIYSWKSLTTESKKSYIKRSATLLFQKISYFIISTMISTAIDL